jgi:N6-adenosine-specific RNA methylase IME4
MDDLEKLRRLIGHWIEHGREHAIVYKEWAEKIQHLDGGTEMASALRDAAKKLYELVECLMTLPHEHNHQEHYHE